MPATINDLPNEILIGNIFVELSLANRFNQQLVCKLWYALMPLKADSLKLISLIEEMLLLCHRESDLKIEEASEASKMKMSLQFCLY